MSSGMKQQSFATVLNWALGQRQEDQQQTSAGEPGTEPNVTANAPQTLREQRIQFERRLFTNEEARTRNAYLRTPRGTSMGKPAKPLQPRQMPPGPKETQRNKQPQVKAPPRRPERRVPFTLLCKDHSWELNRLTEQHWLARQPDYSLAEIKSAFRKAVKRLHPDTASNRQRQFHQVFQDFKSLEKAFKNHNE